jgi:predicted esterase
MERDGDFTAVMAATRSTDPVLGAAWDAYEPLHSWLNALPTYPPQPAATTCPTGAECTGGQVCSNPSGPGTCVDPVLATDIGGAAVFTIRNPTDLVTKLGDAVEAMDPTQFLAGSVVACTSTSAAPSCSDAAGQSFTEVQGVVSMPIFQEGTAPYADVGGGISIDAGGNPQMTRSEQVRFSLSVPNGTMPGAGWPVVIYAHGTGGDYRSHVIDGMAQALAAATKPVAVLGIDQVAHGPRRGASVVSPETLFFNFLNPPGSKGNTLQGAADQLGLVRAVPSISSALAGTTLSTARLDATKVAFLGHSQGSNVGTLAMSRYIPNLHAAVFSGAGGGLLDALAGKTSPFSMSTVVRLVLADPTIGDFRVNPALSLIQGYLEDADPINFGRMVTIEPAAVPSPNPATPVAKHMLHIVGVGDTYTPNRTSKSLALRWTPSDPTHSVSGIYIDGCTNGFLSTDECANPTGLVATPPVGANFRGYNHEALTALVSAHKPAENAQGDPLYDGHFVLFDKTGKALARAVAFLTGWLGDTGVPPTVVE